MKMPLPIPRNAPCGTRYWLVIRVVTRRREGRSVDDRFTAVVPKPILTRLEALDHGVVELAGVPGGVLTRRSVAASDVATDRTAAEVEPPPLVL
jgi:hypothetical protein